MIQIKLLHKEPNEKCYEILKTADVEVQHLKKFKIDKNTLLQNLPLETVIEFLDFIGLARKKRVITLRLIKNGKIVLHFGDDNFDEDWRD